VKHFRAFGPFRFDPSTGEIWRGETVVRLPNQPARMLTLLTGRPGELVTREELRQAIWDGETFVDFDACLNHCARKIRVALGDAAESPAYLETVPRRGYRFIASVETERPVVAGTRHIGLEPRTTRIGVEPQTTHTTRMGFGPQTTRTTRMGFVRWPVSAALFGLAAGALAMLVAEQSPWHDPVVQWLHLQLGHIPGVCYWPS
jgi:DNA-binding winged helix-turn-helix (wHTH) protein